jgi:hypothetical protein
MHERLLARVYAKNLSRKNLKGILTSRAIEKLLLNSIEAA